jgi:hypothetical protein
MSFNIPLYDGKFDPKGYVK